MTHVLALLDDLRIQRRCQDWGYAALKLARSGEVNVRLIYCVAGEPDVFEYVWLACDAVDQSNVDLARPGELQRCVTPILASPLDTQIVQQREDMSHGVGHYHDLSGSTRGITRTVTSANSIACLPDLIPIREAKPHAFSRF